MGGSLSARSRSLVLAQQQRQTSQDIDIYLNEEHKRIRREVGLLLLGTDSDSSSKILQQMQIIHLGTHTPAELALSRPVVYKALVSSTQNICLALLKLGLDWVEPRNRAYMRSILFYCVDSDPKLRLSPYIAAAIESLVNDPVIDILMDRSSKFYPMEFASYFFSQAQRIGSPNYIPNDMDIWHTRARTNGVTETRLMLGQLSVRLFDVSGQRTERRKWIHCFEGIASIMFCVAISEYDEALGEGGPNRLQDSLLLFESIVNSRWFNQTSVILFLTKIDVFKQKLPKSPLSEYFPDYAGGSDINKAAKFILWRFMCLNRARLSIYPHLTQATDTSNIRLIFSAVKETILSNALKDSGIL